MRYAIFIVALAGCGGALPDATTCTLDGDAIAGPNCYANASHIGIGVGAVFGIALQRPTDVYYFEATTISRGSSTFPGPNSDMARTINVGMANETTCDGVGSATWTDDGTMFCVTTVAKCETTTPMTHVACVPSSMMR